MASERHTVAFMVGIIVGALAGAIATLLLTPLSGTQTRDQLMARGRSDRDTTGGSVMG
jgi:gas vesicle protein